MRNILILASAAALSAIVSTPALAGGAETGATRAVSYGDLNLGNSAGVAVLKQRIRQAAASVCRAPDSQDAAGASRVRACVDNAMSEANASVARAISTARGA